MRMLALMVLLATGPAVAQGSTRIDIALSSFRYTPEVITLRHGEPYILHLTNAANGAHDFAAPAFFAAAQIDPQDRISIPKGRVEVEGGAARDIHLVAPAPGVYPVHCTHFMHTTFGMKGRIVVE